MFDTPIPPAPGTSANPGQFMAPAGGGGSNVLNGINQGMPAPMQQGMGAPVSMPGAPSPTLQPQIPTPFNPEQARMEEVSGIMKALQDRLNAHTEIDKAKAGIHKSQLATMPLGGSLT